MLGITTKIARSSRRAINFKPIARAPKKRRYCLLYPPSLLHNHNEVTIYIKVRLFSPDYGRIGRLERYFLTQRFSPFLKQGFLARGESADDFNAWFGSHQSLSYCEQKKWGPRAAAFRWQNGSLPLPIPLASGALLGLRVLRLGSGLARLTPIGLLASLGVDAVLYAGLLAQEFYKAEQGIEEQSARLADTITLLHKENKKVRVVAHSLGCRLAYHAMCALPEEHKPQDVHLLAPAFTENEVEPYLDSIAKDNVLIYHNGDDYILSLLYTGVTGGSRAVGCAGLTRPYNKVRTLDTANHFSWRVHGEYRNEFYKFAL